MNEDIFHLGIKALICDQAGKILLLQVNPKELKEDNRSYWDLPGGRVERGHGVLETLRREIKEETGVTDVTITKHLGMVLSNIRIPLGDGSSAGLILSIYQCEVPDDADIAISREHIAHQWFSPKEAAELLSVKYPEDFCAIVGAL